MTAIFARFPLRGISGEERCKRHTVKECSPRNVKRRGAGCRFRSDSLYEQINENPASEEHAEREKKKKKKEGKKRRIERESSGRKGRFVFVASTHCPVTTIYGNPIRVFCIFSIRAGPRSDCVIW